MDVNREKTEPVQRCRLCGKGGLEAFLNLGMTPLANAFRKAEDRLKPEPFFPLRVLYCPRCFLVQTEDVNVPEELFGDYPYFSSYSTSWLDHARQYAADATRFP